MEYIGVIDDIGNGQANMYFTDELIVRCKDCKYFEDYGYEYFHDKWLFQCKTLKIKGVKPDNFCAWGVKR